MLPTDEKKLLIDRINSADSKGRLEVVVSLVPLQLNGERYQIANVLDDLFWYVDFPALTLEYCKEWMIKRVHA